jgi:DNA-binding NtrC family response regulator
MTESIANGSVAPARLLLVDRDGTTAGALIAPLQTRLPAASVLVEARCGRQAADLLKGAEYDVVLADLSSLDDLAPRGDDAVARLARMAPGALILVFLDGGSVSVSMTVMRAGAHECMQKPVSGEALALRIGALALRLGRPRALGIDGGDMIGKSRFEERAAAMPEIASPVLPMWRQEQRIIEEAIRTFAGNVTLAAAALELSPSTIYRKRQAWAEVEGKFGTA